MTMTTMDNSPSVVDLITNVVLFCLPLIDREGILIEIYRTV